MDSFVGRDDAIFYSWTLFLGDIILRLILSSNEVIQMMSEPRLMMSDHALSPNFVRYAIRLISTTTTTNTKDGGHALPYDE